MQKVIYKTLGVLMNMAICITCVDGKLLVRPRNTVAIVGELTFLNCSTDEPDGKIQWLKGKQHVYAGDKILNFDVKRFSVELDNETGSCNLVIQNVTVEDAGSYTCKDIDDNDNPGVAALTLLDSGPLCQSNVKSDGFFGPNDCNIVPEILNLSCSVTYHGNTPPNLHWKSVNDHTPEIASGETCKTFRNDTMKGGNVKCDLRVKAELYLHKSSFVCQTNLSATEQYGCSSDLINVLYAFSSFHVIEKAINETVKCSVNSTAQCNYKWLLNNTVIDEGSSTVTFHRPGLNRCEAMCDMRGSQCPITAMLVHVNTGPEPKTGAETSSTMDISSKLAIAFGILFAIAIVLIICLLLYLCRSRSELQRIKAISGENHELEHRVSNSSPAVGYDAADDRPLLHTELDELRSKLEAKECELAVKEKELEDKQKELDAGKREIDNEKTGLKQGKDNVLIIGPFDGSIITGEVLKTNLQNSSESYHVEGVPERIYMKTQATAAVYHNTVYVVGLGTYADKICKYESKSGWNECASLTQGRQGHSAAFVDEILYICGGFVDRNKGVLDSVEAYNAVDNTCKSVGKLIIPVQSSGNCVAYKKSLYIFAGADNENEDISDVQVYDIVNNTCHLMSNPLPDANSLMRAALYRDSVILLGQRNCFIYDFSTKTWQARKQFKTDVVNFGLVLSNDRIYVIGGGIDTTDAKGKLTWKCRNDVRSVAIEEVIEDKPAQWKVHGRLPNPCLVYAFALVNQQHDNTDEV